MTISKDKLIVAISNDFLKSFSGIPKKQQSKVREFFEKLRVNPLHPPFIMRKFKKQR